MSMVAATMDSRFPRGQSSRLPLSKKPRNNKTRPATVRQFPNPIQPRQEMESESDEERINSESDETKSPSRSRSCSCSPTPQPTPTPSPEPEEEFEPSEDEEEEEEEADDNNNNVQPSEAAPRLNDTGIVLSNPRVLDCPKCHNPLSPPVYQCENGHFIHVQCSTFTRKKCPNCGTTIKNNPCRGIEMILQSVETPCQYTNRGCKVKLSYAMKPNHEKYCQYASCYCPLLNCNYVNTCFNLYNHFQSRHPNGSRSLHFNVCSRILLSKDENQVIFQERYEKILFVLNRFNVSLGSLINVICVAPCPVSAKYTYLLTAFNGAKKIFLKSFVDSKPSKLLVISPLPKENCLVITNGFTNAVGSLDLELNIRRC